MTSTQLSKFYTHDINNLTLAKALDEHYKINVQFTRFDQFKTIETGNIVKLHDISHLIYGCDTSYGGEYKVQMWNNNGSKLIPPKITWKVITSGDFKALIGLVLPPDLISYFWKHRKECKAIKTQVEIAAKNMTKKWDYNKIPQYMHKTISEIRAEHNIQILY